MDAGRTHEDGRRARARILSALTSLGLTIACLSALMVLVLVCTLAQVRDGTWAAVATTMRAAVVRWRIPGTELSVPVFPGGVAVGAVLLANLVAAQLARLERSWRKVGIWLAHAGLVLLVAGEFVTGAFQVETRIAIEEGETATFAESPRELELAILESTGAVHVVPGPLLARGGTVAVPGTPLTVDVKRWWPNAAFAARAPSDPRPLATAGVGPSVNARPLPPETADDRVNRVAAWVELLAGGRSHGTWLVSNALASPQSFAHGGRTYALGLRPRRRDLGYRLTLKNFRHEVHPGTDIAKSFSSLVHLSNPATGEERDVLISMNEPLRYAGRTFYQSSFGKDDRLSVLQVVENPGWLLPYVATALVALGLLVHFALSLRRDARRRAAREPAPDPAPAARRNAGARLARAGPWLAAALVVCVAGAAALPRGPVRGLDLDGFARLPVLEAGRLKPVDSVARNAMLAIRGEQGLVHADRRIDPDEWLLDVMFRPDVADAQPAFVVDDPDLLGLLGVRPGSERRVAMRTLVPHLAELERQSSAARQIEPRRRTRFQRAVVQLFDRVRLYHRLRNTVQLGRGAELAVEIASATAPGAAERREKLASLAAFRPLPPRPGEPADRWRSAGEALRGVAAGRADAALVGWARLARAYRAGDAAAFNDAVAELAARSAATTPHAARRAWWEAGLNGAQPFVSGMVLYLLALLAVCASWAWQPRLLQRLAFALLAASALVHTAGLACRVALQGRPPVTNLYSSAVFVGWAVVVLGILIERRSRRGFGTAVAAASGFTSLIIAHHLTGDGDTLEMMRAVLDSNFWLATHVVAITIGYAGTFLAGALAIVFAIRRHLRGREDASWARPLVSSTYGVLCFALFFSFLGTVLGGIWADQSWGRFWGWDPKENGALLIVLWNAIILHARLAGYVRERGLMAMAIAGNAITGLSWFGVNMLGVGLHSYGFMDRAFWALSAFVATQAVLLCAALVPPRLSRVPAPRAATAAVAAR